MGIWLTLKTTETILKYNIHYVTITLCVYKTKNREKYGMSLVTIEKLSKAFGNRQIFKELSFGIQAGDKIGVIGVNGTGKSTLLKIIAGWSSADSGAIIKANGARVAYLPQDPYFEKGTTVLKQVFAGNHPQMVLLRDYMEATEALEKHRENTALEKKVALLAEQMEKTNAWGFESEAKMILTKLGITDFFQDVSELSGGQKKRIALASALLSPMDLLILDEPTNHIDYDTIEWLEKYLAKYTGALLMVTHDRYFLDRVANQILELDRGSAYSYAGNYSKYLEMKIQREQLEISEERKRQNFLRTELEWVRRGAQARSTKQKARLQRFEEVSSQKALRAKENIEINAAASRLGKKTIVIQDISKSYGDKTLFHDFSYTILRDDRIGITGDNGCGKSTLFQIITGKLQPDSGNVEIGDTVKIGVFAQEAEDMNPNQTLLEYIRDVAEYVPTAQGSISASQMLENFLFPMDMQRSPISILSGGEKRRLYLLRILMDAPNILFLDEPTNDLDITTLAILEQYLDTFQGAVVTISHDRYFLDRVAERMFVFEEDGLIRQYEGGYSDYKQTKEKQEKQEDNSTKKVIKKEADTEKSSEKQKVPTKMTYKDQREWDTIEDTIQGLEQKLEELEKEIEENAANYVLLQQLSEQKQELEAELEQKMNRWMELSELVQQLEQNKKNASSYQ
jgi:ATP-binding cassette subfamily F protein uup